MPLLERPHHQPDHRKAGEEERAPMRLFGALLLSSSILLVPFLMPSRGRNAWDTREAVRVLHSVRSDFRRSESLIAERRRLHGTSEAQALSVGKRGLSPKPFFAQVVEHYGPPRRQHSQHYAAGGLDRRLNTGTLTASNTAPIRFHINYDTLYEDKVQANPLLKDRYCWRAGDWYRVGHPKSAKPSGQGPDNCNRDSVGMGIVHENKWCLCVENDVITADLIRLVKESTDSAVAEIPKYLNVIPVSGNLTFKKNEGSYPGMWKETGQQGVYCDADCVKGSHVVTPEILCQGGVNADVVLSLVLPPPIPNVGGTGGYCSSDQNGRPLHLVFTWHMRPDSGWTHLSWSDQVEFSRPLVFHEVLHGLGFGSGLWRNSYSSDGKRRKILEQLQVSDADGAEDAVYHFVKGTRTYEAAKLYFGCKDDADWKGFPLMGWPPYGRDSHHETRIMRDDVMSYGDGDAVSAITLAAFEDSGHYLGNYSNAECIHWGRGRGCPFVTSRCSLRPSVETVRGLSASSNCDRTWSTQYGIHSKQALEKCAAGCTGSSHISNNSATCDVECFTGPAADLASAGAAPCTERPAGDVETAGPEGWVNTLTDEIENFDGSLQSFLDLGWLILIPLNICLFGCCLKQLLCPAGQLGRSKTVFYFLTGIVVLLGLAIIGASGYVLYSYSTFEGYVGMFTVIAAMIGGILILLLACFGIQAVYRVRRCQMVIYLVLGVILLLFFTIAVALFAKFSRDIDGLSRNSLTAAGQGGLWADKAIAFEGDVYAQMESFVCRTYQLCCEPTKLFDLRAANGAPRQCKSQHEGAIEDEAFVLSDPSHPKFCPWISGVDEEFSAATGVCDLIETASGEFDLEQCRQDYCSLGLEGYENFISVSVSLFRKNMRIACIVIGVMISFMVVQLMNLFYIWKQTKNVRVNPEAVSVKPPTKG